MDNSDLPDHQNQALIDALHDAQGITAHLNTLEHEARNLRIKAELVEIALTQAIFGTMPVWVDSLAWREVANQSKEIDLTENVHATSSS